VSTADINPSNNGHGSDIWSESWMHIRVDRRSPGYCRVTFDHPPSNTLTATTVAELAELVGLIEEDRDLDVVVFDSANPQHYLAGPTGMHAWPGLLARLVRVPMISIASIRGRARDAGSEFVLACDLRFASRENTLLGLLAGDFDGPRAERCGYVDRAIPDDRLDNEVDAIAARLVRSEPPPTRG
jgi:enoyl-CoA hydratase/carnithine racemase